MDLTAISQNHFFPLMLSMLAKLTSSRAPILSAQRRWTLFPAVGVLLLAFSNIAECSEPYFLGTGDPIGLTSSTTNNRGGFAAVEQDGQNLGEPAIAVMLTGQELLNEFRVVVFGNPSSSGKLLFNEFDYRLKFWRSEDYFIDAEPEFELDLGDPMGLQLVETNPTNITPAQSYGNAGIFGNNADTYDFHFDLTSLPEGDPSQQFLAMPLSAGEWVMAFQSRHRTPDSGILAVATSGAPVGLLPLLSREDDIPRGILGGQDPEAIFSRWGISITARTAALGDFDNDTHVDADDLAIWQLSFGIDDKADADNDGDSDAADFLAWQRTLSINPLGNQLADSSRVKEFDQEYLTIWKTNSRPISAAGGDSDGDGGDFSARQKDLRLIVPPLIATNAEAGGLWMSDAAHGWSDSAQLSGNYGVGISSPLKWKQGTASRLSATIPEPTMPLLTIEILFCVTSLWRCKLCSSV